MSEKIFIPGNLYKTKGWRLYHTRKFPPLEGNYDEITDGKYVLYIGSTKYLYDDVIYKACILLYENIIYWWAIRENAFNDYFEEMYELVS